MNSRIKISLHILAIALLLFLLSWWSMSSLTFLQSDTGLRFWQTRELIAREWSSFAIRYPAQAFDPDLRFVPFYCAYSIVQGKLFFEITPFVPLLASFLFPRLGAAGLAVVPALSGTLIALGMYYLARLGGLRRPYLLLWGSVLATPLFFYTLQLWDHSPAVACAVWGVYGAARGLVQRRWPPLFWGGVVLAVGLGQRPEMYLFVLALAASALLVHRQQWRLLPALAGGGLLGVLPIWWFQLAWFGHPFGMAFAPHLFGYGRPPAHVFTCQAPGSALRYGRFLMYIDGRDLQSFAAALLAIGALFLLLLGLRMPRLRRPWLLLSALALAAVGYALWGEMMWHSLLPGLLTTCPFLGLSLAYLEQNEDGSPTRPVYRLVFFTTLLFLVGMVALWPAYGGDHFGGRYLLPAYPLLLFLAVYVFEAYEPQRPLQRSLRVLGAGLLLIALAIQLMGVRQLFVTLRQNAEVKQAIADLPVELVLTNHPFLATTHTALADKQFMYVDDEVDFDVLVPRFAAAGVRRFAFISLRDLPLSVPDRPGGVTLRQITPVLFEIEPTSE